MISPFVVCKSFSLGVPLHFYAYFLGFFTHPTSNIAKMANSSRTMANFYIGNWLLATLDAINKVLGVVGNFRYLYFHILKWDVQPRFVTDFSYTRTIKFNTSFISYKQSTTVRISIFRKLYMNIARIRKMHNCFFGTKESSGGRIRFCYPRFVGRSFYPNFFRAAFIHAKSPLYLV